MTRLSDHFLDVVRGLPTLRAFNRGAAQADRLAATGEEYRATTMQVLRVSFLSGAVLDLAATLGTALVAVSLGLRLVDGDVALRPALAGAAADARAVRPAARARGAVPRERGRGRRRRADPRPARRAAALTGGHAEPPQDWEVVRLESVRLTYPGRAVPALDGLDLELRRGEVVALVGPTGAGKSTVAALLLGPRRSRLRRRHRRRRRPGVAGPGRRGAGRCRGCRSGRRCSAAPCATPSRWVGRTPPTSRSGRPRSPHRSTAPSSSCRTATRPRWARALGGCPSARRGGWPWPGRSCATHRCWSSTSRQRTWTRTRPTPSPRRSVRPRATGPCCWSSTGRRWRRSPTGSSGWRRVAPPTSRRTPRT